MHQDTNLPTSPDGSTSAAQQRKRKPIVITTATRRRTMESLARGAGPSSAADVGHPWDEAAEGWSLHGALLSEWLRAATSAMLDAARIGSGSRVLDIAAGAGNQTLDIARRVGTTGFVLATDISVRSLELAQGKLRAAGFDQITTRVADAQALGLDGAGFDAAVCRLGLMFCHAPLAALRRIFAALKPDGRFSGLVFSSPQGNPCVAVLIATAMRHAGLPPLPPGVPGQPGTLLSRGQTGLLAELLDTAGFIDIKVRTVSAPMHLPSCQHYIDFIRTAGLPIMAILTPLSAAAQTDAWLDMAAQLDTFTTSTGWVGPNELLLCAATRPAAHGEMDPSAVA